MLPYYIFLVIVILFASLSSVMPKNKLFLVLTLMVMVLFAGLRDAEVGTDSSGYARTYIENARTIDGNLYEQITDEVGYSYLTLLLGGISREYVLRAKHLHLPRLHQCRNGAWPDTSHRYSAAFLQLWRFVALGIHHPSVYLPQNRCRTRQITTLGRQSCIGNYGLAITLLPHFLKKRAVLL